MPNAGMNVNRGFEDAPQTITMKSKMDSLPDDDDINFDKPIDTPF